MNADGGRVRSTFRRPVAMGPRDKPGDDDVLGAV
jgi:hypothetical protein